MEFLSVRMADSLYWMGRYLQRFESVSHEIVSSFDLIIDIDAGAGKELFKRLDYEIAYTSPTDFITQAIYDIPYSSLAFIIQNARENAITSRDILNDHAFASINAIYNRIVLNKSVRTPFDIEEMIRELDGFWGLISASLIKPKSIYLILFGQAVEMLDLELRLYDDTELVTMDVVRLNEIGKSIDENYTPLALDGCSLAEAVERVNSVISSLVKYEI